MTVGINQELGPIKFCFFIKSEMGSLTKAIQIANCFWGGRNSPIFPLAEKFDPLFRRAFSAYESEEDFYKNVLKNFNPDIIIVEDDLPRDLISRIAGGRLLASLNQLENSLLKLENTHGLTVLEILYEIVTGKFEYKRNDDLHIHLAVNEKDDPLISILFNTPLKALSKMIHESLQGKEFTKLSEVDIADFHSLRVSNSITYTGINSYKLIKQRSFSDHYEYVFIFKRDDLSSLSILWNLKSAGRKVYAFPISNYKNGELDAGLIEFYEGVDQNGFGPSIVGGPFLTQEELTDAFNHIRKVVHEKYNRVQINYQHWIPRFGSDTEIAQKDGVVSSVFVLKTSYDQVKSQDGYLEYPLVSTEFKTAKHTYRKTHKITSYIKYFDEFLNFPSVIDGIDNLDWVRLTHSMSSENFRISNGGIIRFCAGDKSDIHFKIPETSNYLKAFFGKKKLKFSIPPQGELTKQILKNIGGAHGISRFSSVGAVKVLEALENENVLTSEHLVSLVKQHKPSHFENRDSDFVSILLENRIIELGALIPCTVCFQRSFYPLSELAPEVICKNCRTKFSPPQNNPKETFKWNYRGIGPFSRSNKIDGLLSCFFTLNLFERGIDSINDGITSFMNFLLECSGTSLEVDLIVQLRTENFSEDRTDLMFCECKTYRNFTQVDINRMKFLGETFPGSILVLSTLNDKFTPEEIILISSLVNHFRQGHGKRPLNPVFVLTSNELLPKKFYNVFEHYGEIHSAIRHNDYLGYLCQKSCSIYLGMKMWDELKTEEWITEQNRRRLLGNIIYNINNHIISKL